MPIELLINGQSDPEAGFIDWTPVPLVIRRPTDGSDQVLRLSSSSSVGSVARVWFSERRDSPRLEQLEIRASGGDTVIFVAGMFQPGERHNGASEHGKDVRITAIDVGTGTPAAEVDVMIRVRKNANELSDAARNDFLNALARLNGIAVDSTPTPGPGKGIYCTDFVEMHVAGASDTEHGDSHFLPWHRLYLLDLERLLQEVNPAVTIPYWRFDRPAPNLFTEEFMGLMQQIPRDLATPGGEFDQGGANTPLALFAPSNPLSKWRIRNAQGIPRTARFDPTNEPANGLSNSRTAQDFGVRSQLATLALGHQNGGAPELGRIAADAQGRPSRTGFSRMEGSPHGAAHVSFNGYINFVPVAPQDPLFFLLHCNVDRLWCLWQTTFERDIENQPETYPYQSSADTRDPWKHIDAEQWPWFDGLSVPGSLRPPGTRKHNFADSPVVGSFPGGVPRLADAIDPYATHAPNNHLAFAYDDVPYRG